MRSLFMGVILTVLILPLSAQEKALELRDCVNPRTVIPSQKSQLAWRGNGETYTYADGQRLMEGTVKGQESELLSLAMLNQHFEDTAEPLKRFPQITWENQASFHFQHVNAIYRYNVPERKMTRLCDLIEGAENIETSAGETAAFTYKGNIYLGTPEVSPPLQITQDGNRELVYGEAAHRFEFGITKGLFWSPQGDRLAFYRMDQTMVTDYPLVDYSTTPAQAKPSKYPMAGQASHHVTVGVYDVNSRETIYLETGEPKEQYLTNVTWDPNGKRIYIAMVNRDQNHMELAAFNAKTGKKVKTLFEEKDEKYVEPEHGPIFCFKESPDKFLWFSERDGNNHLYLYNNGGTLTKQLTQGPWDVTEVLGTDEAEKVVYFMATKESPLERHAYAVNIASGKIELITSEKGMHACELSPTGEYLIDSYSNRRIPRVQQMLRTKNGKQTCLIHSAENPLEGHLLGEMEFVELNADDGTTLYGRLIKPVGFDPNEKYPAITYVYNGPHVQLVTESWNGGAQLFLQYLAGQGYVVFTLDGRGSANRGLAFEQAVFRHLGTKEIQDQLKGQQYLKSLSFVDAERLGIYGWSYGGFMTSSMMLREPGSYQVGVAGGPVVDWKFYEVMYTERYMDTPEANPAGYEESSLLNYVDDLKGHLLIIHGLQDDTVVPQHTRALLRKSVEVGTQLDYYAYPNHPHNVRGWDRVHLLTKIARYFKDYL